MSVPVREHTKARRAAPAAPACDAAPARVAEVRRSTVYAAALGGGILDGIGMALHGEVTVNRGRAMQSNFGDYRLLRLSEAPEVEVHIVDSQEEPTGFGEIALPPCAGAIANAIFAATGKRIRKLPIRIA